MLQFCDNIGGVDLILTLEADGMRQLGVRVLACLPMLQMEGQELTLPSARMVQLPFEEWLLLEGKSRSDVYDRLARRYRNHPPLFLEHWLAVDTDWLQEHSPLLPLQLKELFEPILEITVMALHWYSEHPVIHPLRSVIYFDSRSALMQLGCSEQQALIRSVGVPRTYGESGKFYAVSNETPQVLLTSADQAGLAEMLEFVRASKTIWSQECWMPSLESIALCGTPGLAVESKVLLLVGALEALIIPDVHHNMRQSFRSRMTDLLADHAEDREAIDHCMAMAYQLRSDLVHGNQPKAWRKLTESKSVFLDRLHRLAIQAVLRLLQQQLQQQQQQASRP